MCLICFMTPCHPSCPNASEPKPKSYHRKCGKEMIGDRIENCMAIDPEWRDLNQAVGTREKLNGSGYKELGTGVFVPEEDAFSYAMEKISQDEDLQKEYKEMMVEWFYSGNWIKGNMK